MKTPVEIRGRGFIEPAKRETAAGFGASGSLHSHFASSPILPFTLFPCEQFIPWAIQGALDTEQRRQEDVELANKKPVGSSFGFVREFKRSSSSTWPAHAGESAAFLPPEKTSYMRSSSWLRVFPLFLLLSGVMTSAESPSEVVKRFWTAANEGRYGDAQKELTDKMFAQFSGFNAALDQATRNRTVQEITTPREEILRDEAVVWFDVLFTSGAKQSGFNELVKLDGAWKIDTPSGIRERANAEQTVRKLLTAAEKKDFKSIFELSQVWQQKISELQSDNPQVFWPKLTEDYYQAQKQSFLAPEMSPEHEMQLGIPYMSSMYSGDQHWVGPRWIARLLSGGSEWRIIESRSPDVLGKLRVYVSVSYQSVGVSPAVPVSQISDSSLFPGLLVQQKTVFLRFKQTVLEMFIDERSYRYHVSRWLEQGTGFWEERETNLAATGEMQRLRDQKLAERSYRAGMLELEENAYEGKTANEDAAMAYLNEAIDLDPTHQGAIYERALLRQRKGDYDGAIADFTEVIRHNPRLTMAHMWRGLAHERKGDHRQAQIDFAEAIRLSPMLAERIASLRTAGDPTTSPPESKFAREKWEATIRERLRMIVQMPPPKQDWRELVMMKAAGKFDTYEALYMFGVNRRNLARDALSAAQEFLHKDDLANVEKYVRLGNQYYIESNELFTAADQVFTKSVTDVSHVMEKVTKGGLALGELGVKLACAGEPLCAETASYVVLVIEYGVDSSIYGKDEATRNAMAKVVAKTLLNTSGVSDWIEKRTTYAIGRSGLYNMLDEAMGNPEFQKTLMKYIAESGAFAAGAVTEDRGAELIKSMRGFVLTAANLQPTSSAESSETRTAPPLETQPQQLVAITTPTSPPKPPGIQVLDPAKLIKDCQSVISDSQTKGVSEIKHLTEVFDASYKGSRVKYSGTVDTVKKPDGVIVFKGGDLWPKNWHVQAALTSEQAGMLDTLKPGNKLTVEGTISDLVWPDVDRSLFGIGPSRSIRLSDAVTAE